MVDMKKEKNSELGQNKSCGFSLVVMDERTGPSKEMRGCCQNDRNQQTISREQQPVADWKVNEQRQTIDLRKKIDIADSLTRDNPP